MNSLKKRSALFYFALLSVLATVIALTVELSDDEAYYWSWSQRLDFSYYDHPPLQAWITFLTTHIFGNTNFAVRLPAILGMGLSLYLLARFFSRHNVSRSLAPWVFVSAPIFYAFSWIAMPDVFFLPLALLTVELVETKKFFYAGIALGFALLAKWHAFLLAPGILLFVYFLREISFADKIKKLFLIAMPATILQIPVLYWNVKYDWVAFKFQLLQRHNIHPDSIFKAVLNGLAFVGGFLGIAGIAFIYLLIDSLRKRKWDKKLSTEDWALLTWAAPFIVIFAVSAINGSTRIYWTVFAIFPLTLFFLKHASETAIQIFVKISKWSLPIFAIILSATLYLPIGAYFESVIEKFTPYDLRMSPRGDLAGWHEWATEKIEEEQSGGEKVLFIASDFRLASQLLWNSHLSFDQVTSIDRYHQYAIWPAPHSHVFKKAIFFGDNRRKTHIEDFQKLCLESVSRKNQRAVKLMGQVIKIIDDYECNKIDYDNNALRDVF